MTERLRGRTALITGAAGGMGRAHALRLAREGADLILLDAPGRREDVKLGYKLAGTETLADDPGPWQAVIDVNLTGAFNTAHVFVPRMIAGGRGGSIVIIGSTAGVKGLPFCSAYAASKHGLHGLRKVWAQELAGHGIRVNSIDPGAIDTNIAHDKAGPLAGSAEDSPEARLFLASFNPLLEAPGGLIPPEAISDAVAWLASDEARYVTGVSLPVDAGTTVR